MAKLLKSLVMLLLLQCVCIMNSYADNKINVFVSILPQQYFVQQVGLDLVNVHVLVGPGQNPATYEPTPQQMVALSRADIYFMIGVPFESAWIDKVKLNNKELTIVECCESISNLDNHDHSHEHNTIYDPHVWTSPKKVIKIADLIKHSLVELDENNADKYEAAAKTFMNKLQLLDETIKNKTANLKNRTLIVSHPSWSYFADEYGFSQVSIEQEGKEIQASSMVKLIKFAKERKVKAVFVQPQFNDRAANVVANELDANVLKLDPLALNYIENMNKITDNLVKGLSDE
jgi:zinc transport system substrate-binding protein